MRRTAPDVLAHVLLNGEDGSNVHYLFSVRNMFFSVGGYWPLSIPAGPF
jgi:hypothetical protein